MLIWRFEIGFMGYVRNNYEIVRYLFILVPDQMCEDGRRTVSWYSQRLFRQGRGEF